MLNISALLNFATKASSPSQTDQHIHKAPENILHIQRGQGEISLLYNLPEIQCFAWKKWVWAAEFRPSLLGLGSVWAGTTVWVIFLHQERKINWILGRKQDGLPASCFPWLLFHCASGMGQLKSPWGFTEISTWCDFISQSITRQANKETTKTCWRSGEWCNGVVCQSIPASSFSGHLLTQVASRRHPPLPQDAPAQSYMGIPGQTVLLWTHRPSLQDTATLKPTLGQIHSRPPHTQKHWRANSPSSKPGSKTSIFGFSYFSSFFPLFTPCLSQSPKNIKPSLLPRPVHH